jgi:hypothetical protein
MHERDHRLTLLGRVRSALAEAGVPHALIGAAALALYGVSPNFLLKLSLISG